jgi:hypothetical protein
VAGSLSPRLPWDLASTKWAGTLNPVLALPILNGQQITGISLSAATPKEIPHSLGQIVQGWILVDNNESAIIHRTQPLNAKTITLQASINSIISIWIY